MKNENETLLFPLTSEEIIFYEMKKHKLSLQSYAKIINIVNHPNLEKSLICCHTGCVDCNQKIKACIKAIKEKKERPFKGD